LLLTGILGLSVGSYGCSDDDATGDDDDAPTIDASVPDSGGSQTDADLSGWSDLIAVEWSLPPPTGPKPDSYYCASKTLTEPLYIGGFRPIDPPGTHHTVVSFGAPTGPDSAGAPCSAGTENPNWVYASGVGTNELLMPEGVGVVIEAGQQVHINLHLFNTTDGTLNGRSGVQIIKMNQADVVHEAELFLPGPLQFSIPGDIAQQPYSTSGNCTINSTQTIFALFPHMHQLGQHFKTEILHSGGATETLYDEDYDFEQQPFLAFTPMQLSAGDKIRTTCTWMNTTGSPVSFGQSSTQEMCFSILLRYPRINAGNGLPACPQ
jgi:hypothetical protein